MALICATLGVWLFAFAYKKGWTIKMPKGVPPAVADSFAALVPSGLVMGAAFLVRIGFSFTEFGYLPRLCSSYSTNTIGRFRRYIRS